MESQVFKPEFIPIYMEEYIKYNLSPIEGLVYGFIRFYTKRGMDFFYTSEQLSEIISTTPGSIDNTIRSLKNKGLIITEVQRYGNKSTRNIKLCTSSFDEICISSNDGKHLIKGGDKKEDKKEEVLLDKSNNTSLELETIFFENNKVNSIFLEFREGRRQAKKKMTDISTKRMVSKILSYLSRYSEQEVIDSIEKAIESGWQSIYEPKLAKNFTWKKEKIASEKDRDNFSF